MIVFLGYDAKGTDGSDLNEMDALYSYNGVTVAIPATTPAGNILSAVLTAMGALAGETLTDAYAIGQIDFDALDAAIEGAGSLAALRPRVRDIVNILRKLARLADGNILGA